MAAACRRSYEVSRRMLAPPTDEESTPGQIVTVFAAKGGCGKTALAINLGVALARQARGRVCVVDLDLAFGDVAISVQLDPLRTIVDALPMAGHLDESGAASLLTRYQPRARHAAGAGDPGRRGEDPAQAGRRAARCSARHVRLRRRGHARPVQRARADRDGRLVAACVAHDSGRARAEEPSGHAGHAGHAVVPETDPLGSASTARTRR